MRLPSLVTVLAGLALAVPAYAQHGHGGGHASAPRSSSGRVHVRGYTSRSGKTVQPYTRNAPGEGRSKANAPHGWPGHVVDHRVPLACGGADVSSNMQWQTTEQAKANDRVERRGCGRSH
jgi:hypothetical protein